MEGAEVASDGEGGGGECDGGVFVEEFFAEVGGDVDGGGSQGTDVSGAAAFFDPVDVVVFGEVYEALDACIVTVDTSAVVLDLVVHGSVLDFGEDTVHGLHAGF